MRIRRYIIGILIGLLLSLVIAEGILQFSPVMSGFLYSSVSDGEAVTTYIPQQKYTYSLGWNFRNVVHGRFNNYGYVSDHDYDPKTKNIAVIGNSFVDAYMLPEGRKFSDRLDAYLHPQFRVNAFGMASGTLADYLITMRWASNVFRPDIIIFVLVSGDLTKSTAPKKRGAWFIADGNDVKIETRLDHSDLWLFKSSKFLCYLFHNLKFNVNWLLPNNVNDDETAVTALNEQSKKIADFFVRELGRAQNKTGTKIILVFDADRHSIYDHKQPVRLEADFLMKIAHEQGISTIDLQDIFLNDYAISGRSFDYGKFDWHWNEYANDLIATTILNFLKNNYNIYSRD